MAMFLHTPAAHPLASLVIAWYLFHRWAQGVKVRGLFDAFPAYT
jgi:hypothetical protein